MKKNNKIKNKKKKNKKSTFLKKIIIFYLSVLILLGIGFTSFWFYKYYKYSFSLSDNVTVPLNTNIDPNSYIKTKINVKVAYNEIDTSTIGEKKIKYVVTDKFKKKHYYYLKVTVIDNESPTIECKDQVNIYLGSKVDYDSYIKVNDNYDKNVNVTHEGEIDTSKVGSYKIIYIATDSSNNISKKTITFIVKEKPIYQPVTLENGVVGTSSKGFKIENKGGATYVGGILITNKTYVLSANYGSGLTNETSSAFNEMKSAASLAGIDLYVGSGFRSYNTQKSLYNSYVKRDGKNAADTYSARPGYSEHQTGLAIDICSHNLTKACVNSNFNNTEPANWLSNNAYLYGFILRYPNGKSGETGYRYESWHYRYVGKDLASKLYNGGNWITLEDYLGITSKYS